MNVARSLSDDIKTRHLQWYGHVHRRKRGDCQKKLRNGIHQEGRPKFTWVEGIRGLMEEKGLMEEDWNDRSNWRRR